MSGKSADLSGILPVDKPHGWTSHDVVDWVRDNLGHRKAGHTGTLDPIATGVLVLCLGRATRLSSLLSDQDKSYWSRIRLGVSTDTLDVEGKVTARSDDVPTDHSVVSSALKGFVGDIEQIPPMFSALKVGGKRLYELARQGRTAPVRPRRVRIHRIDIVAFSPPFLELSVSCSKGTYIRVLADDVGRTLGCGGHVAALRRTAVGNIALSDCVDIDRLRCASSQGTAEQFVMDPNQALAQLPSLRLNGAQIRRFVNGNPVGDILLKESAPRGPIRVLGFGDSLLGIGRWAEGEDTLKPVRVFPELVG